VDEWLDTKSMRALSQHASAILTALLLFGLIALVLKLIPLPDPVKFVLDGIEDLGLIDCLVGSFGRRRSSFGKGEFAMEISHGCVKRHN